MKYLPFLLFASLVLLFYSLIGPLPHIKNAGSLLKRYGFSIAGTVIFFVLGRLVFDTVLAGLFWAILGWFLPPYIIKWLANLKKKKFRALTKSFIAASSGLYSAGQTTPEVIRSCAERFPEPFAADFQNMLGMRNLNAKATYPDMFRGMAKKYDMPEFNAVAAVIEAAERSGGPPMAARGLKRLSQALRHRDRLLQERAKNNFESLLAAVVVLVILGGGLILNATVLKPYFEQGAGKLVLALSSGLVVGMLIITIKTASSRDLA